MALLHKTVTEYIIIMLTVAMGMIVTLWLALAEYGANEARIKEQFRIAANDRINVISRTLNDNLAVSHSVTSFFESSNEVSRDEFARFTSQILASYPYIEALEWAPRVEGSSREAYETEARLIIPDYGFKDIHDDNSLIPSGQRNLYYPIYYLEPVVDYTARVYGVDFMTNPVRRKAMELAMSSGKTTATTKVTLLSSHRPGVLFFSPVHKQERLSGFVISVIPLGEIVAKAIEPLNKEHVNIIAYDVTDNAPETEPLFIHTSRLQKASDEEVIEIYRQSRLRESATIDIAMRKWRLTVLPSRGWFEASKHKNSYIILGAGLVFTIMLAYYMVTRIRENRRIMREVDARTRELAITKKEVELILHSTSEGIIGLDRTGNITFCNAMSGELLGYTTEEMVGHNFHELVHHCVNECNVANAPGLPIINVLQKGGEVKNIDNESFCRKTGAPLEVEYTVSAMMEEQSVAGAVIIFRDIAERKLNQEKLEQMARYDQLTGLANRRLFLELLQKSFARASRTGGKVALVYLDLNDFKPINDTLGHAAGDMLLKEFGRRVSSVLREHDTMARLGGDEFAILMEAVQSESDCHTLLNRILAALNEKFPIAGSAIVVTASIGVALYPDHAGTVDDLLATADHAMYEAKKDKSRPYIISNKHKMNPEA